MKRISKNNKKAFTLVEMMLAIAITLIISSVFVALMVSIQKSYYKVYTQNDATDYAALFSQALENYMLVDYGRETNAATGSSITYSIHSTDTDCSFCVNGTSQLSCDQITGTNGYNKWYIMLDLSGTSFDAATGMLTYRIVVVDGTHLDYAAPGVIQLTYEGSFWLPHFDPTTSGSIAIEADGPAKTYSIYGGGTRSITPARIIYSLPSVAS